jgi:hypothetical protein
VPPIEPFPRVDWVAVPKALRARRVNSRWAGSWPAPAERSRGIRRRATSCKLRARLEVSAIAAASACPASACLALNTTAGPNEHALAGRADSLEAENASLRHEQGLMLRQLDCVADEHDELKRGSADLRRQLRAELQRFERELGQVSCVCVRARACACVWTPCDHPPLLLPGGTMATIFTARLCSIQSTGITPDSIQNGTPERYDALALTFAPWYCVLRDHSYHRRSACDCPLGTALAGMLLLRYIHTHQARSLSRVDRSLPASASGSDTHRDSIGKARGAGGGDAARAVGEGAGSSAQGAEVDGGGGRAHGRRGVQPGLASVVALAAPSWGGWD